MRSYAAGTATGSYSLAIVFPLLQAREQCPGCRGRPFAEVHPPCPVCATLWAEVDSDSDPEFEEKARRAIGGAVAAAGKKARREEEEEEVEEEEVEAGAKAEAEEEEEGKSKAGV